MLCDLCAFFVTFAVKKELIIKIQNYFINITFDVSLPVSTLLRRKFITRDS
jgi:hypothetical protein